MQFRKVIAAVCMAVAGVGPVGADVILPNYHYVARCVTIANLDEFPDIVIVGEYIPISQAEEAVRYIVKTDSCLTKGYKFNSFYLFWVEKTYLESQGLENLPLADLLPRSAKQKAAAEVVAPQIGLFATQIEPLGGTLPDSNPVVSERLIYRLIVGEGNGRFEVRLAEKVSIDKDGYATTENFLTVGIAALGTQVSGSAPLNLNARLGRGYLLFSPGFNGPASGELIDCRGRAAVRFTRECRTGCTYMVRSTNLSAGIYWLRVKSNGVTVNRPMRSFE